MHICMPLIILMKLTSSHSTPLTHLISLNSSHLCSYIYFFCFIYPSPLCFFIKLLTCGVIRLSAEAAKDAHDARRSAYLFLGSTIRIQTWRVGGLRTGPRAVLTTLASSLHAERPCWSGWEEKCSDSHSSVDRLS